MREKWSITRLNEETSIDRRTIKSILGATSPIDSDGKVDWYYLSDFIEAYKAYLKGKMGGDAELIAEKIRDTKESADGKAMDNEERRGILVEIADLCRRLEPIYTVMAQIVQSSKLSDEEKDQLLDQFSRVHSIIRPKPAAVERNGDTSAGVDPATAPAPDNSTMG